MPIRWFAAMALAASLAAVAACSQGAGVLSHGTRFLTVHGHEVVVIDPNNNTEIWGVFRDVTTGTPVTVQGGDSSRVIGSGALSLNSAASRRAGVEWDSDPENVWDFIAIYDFEVTVPAGLPQYGITIGTGHGTVWFTAAQMEQGPVLMLGSLALMLPLQSIICPRRAQLVAGPCAESAGGSQFVTGR